MRYYSDYWVLNGGKWINFARRIFDGSEFLR